jgi:hypothetical protein
LGAVAYRTLGRTSPAVGSIAEVVAGVGPRRPDRRPVPGSRHGGRRDRPRLDEPPTVRPPPSSQRRPCRRRPRMAPTSPSCPRPRPTGRPTSTCGRRRRTGNGRGCRPSPARRARREAATAGRPGYGPSWEEVDRRRGRHVVVIVVWWRCSGPFGGSTPAPASQRRACRPLRPSATPGDPQPGPPRRRHLPPRTRSRPPSPTSAGPRRDQGRGDPTASGKDQGRGRRLSGRLALARGRRPDGSTPSTASTSGCAP